MEPENRVESIWRKIRDKGARGIARHLAYRARRAARYFSAEQIIARRRIRLSEHVAMRLGHTVRSGPFSRMKLQPRTFWAQGDIASKILGLYEQEVQERLARIQSEAPGGLFVDIGGADGYFAVGAVFAGLFERCVVFERAPAGRAAIIANAELNGVSHRTAVLGEARANSFLEEISRACAVGPGEYRILCDIEGGEYDLFTESVLDQLRAETIMIEIHAFNAAQAARRAALWSRASSRFQVEIIRTRGRDLSPFPELAELSDADRALLMSEGRSGLGEWWLLTPR